MKIFRSKKAQEGVDVPIGRKIPYYVFITIMLAIMISLVVFFTGRLNYMQAEAPEALEDLMIISRFINNPNCLAYEDEEIQRIYPGVIDLKKATQEQMTNCITMADAEPCFKIILSDKKGIVKEVTTNNAQKCRIALKVDVFKKRLVLLRSEDGTTRPGYLQVSKNERN